MFILLQAFLFYRGNNRLTWPSSFLQSLTYIAVNQAQSARHHDFRGNLVEIALQKF